MNNTASIGRRFFKQLEMKVELQKIDDLIATVKTLPKENFYYRGIKENTLNLLIAQSKIGKTTMAENLAMCIAAGYKDYLGLPVWSGTNKKVLLLSLEEYFQGRTERNMKQMAYMDSLVGNKDWHENVIVATQECPRYIESIKDWNWLQQQIDKEKPAFTVIDSLSRMHGSESIEDSSTCIALMKKLRNIVAETGTTLLVIHHTNKIGCEPLTLANMAGSRILSQEADSITALNKTPTGKRYIKPLAYRYADDSSEKVQLFSRNVHQWLMPEGYVNESKILREFDNRVDDANSENVMEYFQEASPAGASKIITTKDLVGHFVTTRQMSTPTLHSALAKLIEGRLVEKKGKGQYVLVGNLN
jgi:hypothetical protein